MKIQDIEYVKKRLYEIYNKYNIEIIIEDFEEYNIICVRIDDFNYQYIIMKECDSVGKVINYIVNDLKKVM